MGMRCYKCHQEMGSLCIPFDSPETPDTMTLFMVKKRILPICERCIAANPRTISADNVMKGR